MSLEASRFRLGLFFTLGTVLFVAMMVWLTGWFRNPDTRPYVCYFSESVQGLETGSSVRYRGVPVGTVERIAVAPDGRLVEVVMDIESDFPVREDVVARLDLVGITGLKAINLRILGPGETASSVVHDFEPPCTEIPVMKSSMENLEVGLERLVEIVTVIDFEGISSQTVQLLQSLNEIMDSDSLSMLISSLARTSSRIDTLVMVYTDVGRDLQAIADRSGGEISGMARDLRNLTVQLDQLLGLLQPTADGLGALLVQTYSLMDDMRAMMDMLRNHPEELLMQSGGEDRWP
ncbi:MCE family protein [Candidatus Fermentibacteria bacterium]|nr:MCE family protein [Candidatus Fermentibacteria bacterium]